jgi:hypothetical protein
MDLSDPPSAGGQADDAGARAFFCSTTLAWEWGQNRQNQISQPRVTRRFDRKRNLSSRTAGSAAIKKVWACASPTVRGMNHEISNCADWLRGLDDGLLDPDGSLSRPPCSI